MTKEDELTKEKKLRRVVRLCCCCAGNFTYYRAGRKDGKLIRDTEFWRYVNGNSFDMCVIDWCKLFSGKKNDKHRWENIVDDPDDFGTGLLRELGMEQDELDDYRGKMIEYRDKFGAHLDFQKEIILPYLETAFESVVYYHTYVLQHAEDDSIFTDLPTDIRQYCNECSQAARAIYV